MLATVEIALLLTAVYYLGTTVIVEQKRRQATRLAEQLRRAAVADVADRASTHGQLPATQPDPRRVRLSPQHTLSTRGLLAPTATPKPDRSLTR